MKRTLLIFLTLILCLSAFAGCQKNDTEFDFSCEAEKTKYVRGETIRITATVTNVSGKTYRYTGCSGNDFIPIIELYNESDEQKYSISAEPITLPTDVVQKEVANGESGSTVYSFLIPKDAKLGKYSVTLSLGDSKREFVDIISIVELTSQNENENYSYGAVLVRSGEDNINPIEAFVYEDSFLMDGTPVLSGCGDGRYRFFSDSQTNISDFPTLVANGKIEISSPDSSKIGNPNVYDTKFNEYKYFSPGWNGLHLLPEGEYIVAFFERTDSRNTSNNSEMYYIREYDNIFRLIIPPRTLGNDYHSISFNNTSSLASDFDLNAKYRAGERVEIKLQTITEHYYIVTVNGENIPMIGGDLYYSIFAFIMPDEDVEIEIKDKWVTIPYA